MSPDTLIHVTRWGATGPRIVMIHGGVQGSAVGGDRHFAAQQRLGARGYQVVVPDRPGHGQSPDPRRPDDAAADGDWVKDMLGDGAHLVGHSFGGLVALAAAASRPAAVRSLTLIEPAMLSLAPGSPAVLGFLLRLMAALVLSPSAAARAHKLGELMRIPAEVRSMNEAEATTIGARLKQLRLPSRRELVRQLGVVKQAAIPLQVVTGGWNPAFERCSDRAAALGGGRRLIVPCEHHFPNLVGEAFNQALAAAVDAAERAHLGV